MFALLSLSCSLVACGPSPIASDGEGESDTGGGDLDDPTESLPPIELDEWCDDPETLTPFADRGPVTRLEENGPCGPS